MYLALPAGARKKIWQALGGLETPRLVDASVSEWGVTGFSVNPSVSVGQEHATYADGLTKSTEADIKDICRELLQDRGDVDKVLSS